MKMHVLCISLTGASSSVNAGRIAGAVTASVLCVLTLTVLIISVFIARRRAKEKHPRLAPSHSDQQRDMELTHHEIYDTTTNISLNANECYGTTAASVDSDQIYATPTVEGRHHIAHNLNCEQELENYYTIPHM